MSQKIIEIPSIGDEPVDFKTIFAIIDIAKASREDICFEFRRCKSLKPNAVALLGGLVRSLEAQGKKITFRWDSLKDEPLRETLRQNGFLNYFGQISQTPLENAIPYREDFIKNMDSAEKMNSIMDYLIDLWIGRGWVQVSKKLKNEIVGKVWEIYSNAFEHGKDGIGVFTCGEHIKNDLILTVVDFGKGIPVKVREFFKADSDVDMALSTNCLKWAFQPGHTTSCDNIARGLGLDFLKEFIILNHGKLEIYSNDGYVLIEKEDIEYSDKLTFFDGTVVHITLRCDENLYYQFTDEEDPQF